MKAFEKLCYETCPYLFLTVGVAATLFTRGPLLLQASGALLCASALAVIGMRWTFRRRLAQAFHPEALERLVQQDLFYRLDSKL